MSQSQALEIPDYTAEILFGEHKTADPPQSTSSIPLLTSMSALPVDADLVRVKVRKRLSGRWKEQEEPKRLRVIEEEEPEGDFMDFKHVRPSDFDPLTGRRRDTPREDPVPEAKQPAAESQLALAQDPDYWQKFDEEERLQGSASACSSSTLRGSSTEALSASSTSATSSTSASTCSQTSVVPRTPSPPVVVESSSQ